MPSYFTPPIHPPRCALIWKCFLFREPGLRGTGDFWYICIVYCIFVCKALLYKVFYTKTLGSTVNIPKTPIRIYFPWRAVGHLILWEAYIPLSWLTSPPKPLSNPVSKSEYKRPCWPVCDTLEINIIPALTMWHLNSCAIGLWASSSICCTVKGRGGVFPQFR